MKCRQSEKHFRETLSLSGPLGYHEDDDDEDDDEEDDEDDTVLADVQHPRGLTRARKAPWGWLHKVGINGLANLGQDNASSVVDVAPLAGRMPPTLHGIQDLGVVTGHRCSALQLGLAPGPQ